MTAQAVVAYAIGLPVYVMVKAMTPNFFARCDTKTPVKYSVVVLLANLSFSLLLMKPFGHVGIATATTLAAFISFYQYVHGLKKRGFWRFSPALVRIILKVVLCSAVMGMVLWGGSAALDYIFGGWLRLVLWLKLLLFGILCIFGVVTFCIMTKMMKVMDVAAVLAGLMRRKEKNA